MVQNLLDRSAQFIRRRRDFRPNRLQRGHHIVDGKVGDRKFKQLLAMIVERCSPFGGMLGVSELLRLHREGGFKHVLKGRPGLLALARIFTASELASDFLSLLTGERQRNRRRAASITAKPNFCPSFSAPKYEYKVPGTALSNTQKKAIAVRIDAWLVEISYAGFSQPIAQIRVPPS
jgi:hypothetical protein